MNEDAVVTSSLTFPPPRRIVQTMATKKKASSRKAKKVEPKALGRPSELEGGLGRLADALGGIGQLAEAIGVSIRTIQRYNKQDVVVPEPTRKMLNLVAKEHGVHVSF